jgi:hypothetical protein
MSEDRKYSYPLKISPLINADAEDSNSSFSSGFGSA